MRGNAKLFFLPWKLKIMHANALALMEAICGELKPLPDAQGLS